MALTEYNPAKYATEFKTIICLYKAGALITNPTLAGGDVIVSTDDGATSNLDTLPAVNPAAGPFVLVTVSETEMTGNYVAIQFEDVAGAEWEPLTIVIHPAAQQFGDLMPDYDAVTPDRPELP